MIDVAALYKKHGPMVQRRALAVLGDVEAARDVVQEVFMRLHQQRDELAPGGLVSWLYTAATNRCLNLLRDRATRARILDGERPQMPQASRPHAEQLIALRGILPRLSDELARLAVFRFVDEMTHEEIGEVLGCSRRQVGYLLERLESELSAVRAAG